MRTKTPAILASLLLSSSSLAIDHCVSTPVAIPDNSTGGVVVQIDIDAPGELIESVIMDLAIQHDWVGDLVVTLQSPAGTVVTLLDRPGIPSVGFPGPFGCGGRDVSVSFLDIATQDAESMCSTTATPVLSGDVSPLTPLGALAGEAADGLWLLTVSDNSLVDTGQFVQACLHIESTPACTPDFTGDGNLDIFDVFAFIDAFNTQDPGADFNGDSSFDIFDVFAFIDAFNTGC
jgi:subtilisin-like proprotein convertase family protein